MQHRIPALILACAATLVLTAATASAQERFVDVTEGVLDTQTGLVWGRSYNGLLYAEASADGFFGSGPESVMFSWDEAMGWGLADYKDRADRLWGRNDAWRLPTIQEAQAAAEAGLFDLHLNGVDDDWWYWTATPTTKKGKPSRKGGTGYADAFTPLQDGIDVWSAPTSESWFLEFYPIHDSN